MLPPLSYNFKQLIQLFKIVQSKYPEITKTNKMNDILLCADNYFHEPSKIFKKRMFFLNAPQKVT